jgi:mannan endo-1,4-beta-mannosidase
MNLYQRTFLRCITLVFICVSAIWSLDDNTLPVTPNSSPETRALLKFLYTISGKYTLAGQHNYPNTGDKNTQFAAQYIGKTPVIWSTDWGFAKEGDTDSYLARPDIVKEAIKQHHLGSLITICWHAVPPTANEPVVFRGPPDAPPESLASVQGQLLDQQFADVLTPGTELNRRWCAQVDTIARYLKQLQDAKIPILWRPYHEMNGDWFWWGARRGKFSTKALYLQIFDRLVNHHELNNLIWVWSVDRPNRPEMQFKHYFPGLEFLDVLALDVYGRDFKQAYYDSLVSLAHGKPLVLGEVGNPPAPEILDTQPKWSFYVIWAGMVRHTPKKQHLNIINDPRVLCLEDSIYCELINSYRAVCGLDPLSPPEEIIPGFSGDWLFNEDKSVLNNNGPGFLPYKLAIRHTENKMKIKRTFFVEYGDDRISEEILPLDGREVKSEFWNSPRITKANLLTSGDTLVIKSTVTFTRGDQTFEMVSEEVWNLLEQGSILSIQQSSTTFRGEREITMIFEKR